MENITYLLVLEVPYIKEWKLQEILSSFKLPKIAYRKNPKISDTQKICCNHSKIWTRWLYYRVMSPKGAAGMTNSVDPDQSLIWVYTV